MKSPWIGSQMCLHVFLSCLFNKTWCLDKIHRGFHLTPVLYCPVLTVTRMKVKSERTHTQTGLSVSWGTPKTADVYQTFHQSGVSSGLVAECQPSSSNIPLQPSAHLSLLYTPSLPHSYPNSIISLLWDAELLPGLFVAGEGWNLRISTRFVSLRSSCPSSLTPERALKPTLAIYFFSFFQFF